MNTRQLSYIITIAEQGNLSAAAEVLGVSQPALSKYLSELEEELGTDLFLRHKRRLYLTPAGKIYVEAARRICSVREQTYQLIASLSGSYQKTITVGVTPLRGAVAMAKIFPQFNRRYPYINLAMKEQYPADLRQSVLNRSIDMALRTCIDLEDPEVRYISAHEEDVLLFVPPFHPLAHLANRDLNLLTAIDIRRFQDTPFLIGKQGSTIRQLIDIIFQQNQMHPTIVYESDNNLILKNMAQSGAGVTLLPSSHAEPGNDLVYFRLKPGYTMHLAVMVSKDKPLSEEERYLIALNFALESKPGYRFNPCPAARELMDEFHMSQPLYLSGETQIPGRINR